MITNSVHAWLRDIRISRHWGLQTCWNLCNEDRFRGFSANRRSNLGDSRKLLQAIPRFREMLAIPRVLPRHTLWYTQVVQRAKRGSSASLAMYIMSRNVSSYFVCKNFGGRIPPVLHALLAPSPEMLSDLILCGGALQDTPYYNEPATFASLSLHTQTRTHSQSSIRKRVMAITYQKTHIPANVSHCSYRYLHEDGEVQATWWATLIL